MPRPSPVTPPPAARGVLWQLGAVAVAATLSALPPALADLDVDSSVEVADHVVPGLLALAAAGLALVLAARGAADTVPALVAVGLCALCGLWQVATHISLLADIGSPGRPAGEVLVHALPGALLAGLAIWALLAPRRGPGR